MTIFYDRKNPSLREHFLQNNPSLSAYLCRFRPSMRDFWGFYVTNMIADRPMYVLLKR